jgi:hypothetical protein
MKRLLIALLIVFPLAEASGREAKRYDVSDFMVFGGAAVSNYSKLSPWAMPMDLEFRQQNTTGPAAGIGYEVPLNAHVSIDVRFQYARKGASLDWFFRGQPQGTWTYKLFALSDATTLKVKVLSGSSPYLLGGYDLAWVVTQKLAGSGGQAIPSPELKAATHDVDLGAVVGIGAELVLKGWTPFLEVRANIGFLNLSNGEREYFPAARTRALLLIAGIKFPVKTT